MSQIEYVLNICYIQSPKHLMFCANRISYTALAVFDINKEAVLYLISYTSKKMITETI